MFNVLNKTLNLLIVILSLFTVKDKNIIATMLFRWFLFSTLSIFGTMFNA